MFTTRRDFLKASLASGAVLSWGFNIPAFLSRTARGASEAKPKETILVVVQLTGGNDGDRKSVV